MRTNPHVKYLSLLVALQKNASIEHKVTVKERRRRHSGEEVNDDGVVPGSVPHQVLTLVRAGGHTRDMLCIKIDASRKWVMKAANDLAHRGLIRVDDDGVYREVQDGR